jgi:hypothetical protein
MYTPVMERGENKFCLSYKNLMKKSWLEAYLLGFDLANKYGTSNDFHYDGVILKADTTRGVVATLNDLRITLVEGPLFEETDDGRSSSQTATL